MVDSVFKFDGPINNTQVEVGSAPDSNNVYKLFDVLKNLFEKLDLLVSPEDKEDTDTKFRFITEYPDTIYTDLNIVTFGVVRRKPFISNNTIIGSNSVFTKPAYAGEYRDIKSGNVKEVRKLEFSNVISLNAFSNKAKTLNRLVMVLEEIFFKYSSYLKQYIREVVYIGTNEIQVTDTYDEKERILSRELQFHVITTEYFTLDQEEIKSIDFNNATN